MSTQRTLPQTLVLKLACAAKALAAKHMVPVRRGWFGGSNVQTCDQCHRAGVRGYELTHAPFCPVGRALEAARQVIERIEQPVPEPPAPAGLRIAEVPQTPDERSDANRRTDADRAGGDLPGTVLAFPSSGDGLTVDPAPDYLEPWSWDPPRLQVLDRNGLVVTDMDLGTQLSSYEMSAFGERIALCVNLFAGVSNEWLRDAHRKTQAAVEPRPERYDDIVLDHDVEGWYVELNGARVTFAHVPEPVQNYAMAKAYFNATVARSRAAWKLPEVAR